VGLVHDQYVVEDLPTDGADYPLAVGIHARRRGALSSTFISSAAKTASKEAVYLLSRAMDTVPVGTAYAVFTGIGAVGAIVLGVVVTKDPLSVGRVAALALIVGGVVLARVTS